MKQREFVRIDYVAKIKESGEIFDLTDEKVAKERGIFNPKFKYGPAPVIVGANFLVKGLEEELKDMNVGEKRKFTVKPEDGFGKRNPRLIKLLPISEFKKRDVDPYPGMPVTIRNLRGRVLSVSGGRVRIDFNHPLAGKELEYEVEVKEKIVNVKKRVKAVVEFFLKVEKKDINANIENKTAEVNIKEKIDIPVAVKEEIAKTIMKWIKNIEKVRFVEEFSK